MTGQLTVIRFRRIRSRRTRMVFLLSTMAASCATRTSGGLAACFSSRNRGWRISRDIWAKSRSRSARRNFAAFWIEARARQGVAARPEGLARNRQHLCGRKLVPRAPAPGPHRRKSRRRNNSWRCTGRSARFWPKPSVSADLPFQITSIPTAIAANSSSGTALPARREAMFPLQSKNPPRNRGGQEQPFLPALPARAARTAGARRRA